MPCSIEHYWLWTPKCQYPQSELTLEFQGQKYLLSAIVLLNLPCDVILEWVVPTLLDLMGCLRIEAVWGHSPLIQVKIWMSLCPALPSHNHQRRCFLSSSVWTCTSSSTTCDKYSIPENHKGHNWSTGEKQCRVSLHPFNMQLHH